LMPIVPVRTRREMSTPRSEQSNRAVRICGPRRGVATAVARRPRDQHDCATIPSVSWFEAAVVLLAAGTLAGIVGTAGGITSLVSYPALLAVGLPALPANIANLVALVACWPGAALTSRREVAGTKAFMALGIPVAAAGAALGAVLLLSTPAGTFALIVPFLVAAGSLALLVQPRLTAATARRVLDRRPLTLILVGLISVYGGYFGAGSGVLLLAVTLILFDPRLPEANAIKNMLVGASAVAAAAVFVVAGPVEWDAVAPLAVGAFAGSTVGPIVARRAPARVVRLTVAALGLLLALQLWLHPG
jgi:uncharacterized protein